MSRTGLLAGQLEHERAAAETHTRGDAGPRIRSPAGTRDRKTSGRSATAGTPYKRVDGTKMRRLNANLRSAAMSKLEKYLLSARQRGCSRNEWIEAALDDAVERGFMPVTAEAEAE